MPSSESERPAHEAPVTQGQVIAGRYRVGHVLGKGGMGVVVAATDISLGRRVAIKVMAPEQALTPDNVARFMREGRAVGHLASEHVARVFDVGTTAVGKSGDIVPYLVMEYLEGGDLRSVAERGGKMGVEDVVDYVLQACDAIAEAHGQGVIHRDLKPENLFLTRRTNGQPLVKVLDFGISKAVQLEGPSRLTKTGAALGTPFYMAPEQMRSSRTVDTRVDVWALGVILYELLTGRVPFLGQSVAEVAILVASEPPPAPRSLRPDLPEALERVILCCLEKAPAARYPTVEALAADLEPFAPQGPAPRVSARPSSTVPLPSTASSAAMPTMATATSQPQSRVVNTNASWGTTGGGRMGHARSRSRAVIASLVTAGVALTGAFGYALWRPRVPPAQTAAPSSAAEATTDPPSSSVALPAVDAGPAPSAVPVPPQTASAPKAPSHPAPRRAGPTRPAPPTPPKPPPPPTPTFDPGSVR